MYNDKNTSFTFWMCFKKLIDEVILAIHFGDKIFNIPF